MRGAVPGAARRHRGGAHRWLTAPILGGDGKVKLDDGAFGARFNGPLVHETVRAEQIARRRGTAATKTRGEVSRRRREAVAPEGHRPRPRRLLRSPLWTGGGTAFGPQPRGYTFKVNRKARRAALRSALSVHAERGSIARLRRRAFDAPVDQQAAELLADWGQPRPDARAARPPSEADAALSFRNLDARRGPARRATPASPT